MSRHIPACALARKVISVFAAFVLMATLIPANGLAFADPTDASSHAEALAEESSTSSDQDAAADGQDASDASETSSDASAADGAVTAEDDGTRDADAVAPEDGSGSAAGEVQQGSPEPPVDVVAAGVPLEDETATLLTYDGLVYRSISEGAVEAIGWSGEAPSGNVSIPERIMVGNAVYTVVGVHSVTRGVYGQIEQALSVERISLPATVETIDPAFFTQFPYAAALDVAAANNNFSAHDGIVYNADATQLVASAAGTEVALIAPECTTINEGAFAHAAQLRTIIAGDAVSEIAQGAFHENTRAEATVITDERAVWEAAGFTHFGEAAAPGDLIQPEAGQSGLAYKVLDDHTLAAYWVGSEATPAQIEIPATARIDGVPYAVSAVAAEGFRGQTALERVVLSADVEIVGSAAFADCANLSRIVARGQVPQVAPDALEGCTGVSVYVPFDAHGSYAWQLGTPAAGNHLMPYGVAASPQVLYLQVGGTADAFAGGFCEAPGAMKVSYAYRGQVDVREGGVIKAKQLGTTPITVTLSLDGVTLAESSTTAVVSLLPAMQAAQGGAPIEGKGSAVSDEQAPDEGSSEEGSHLEDASEDESDQAGGADRGAEATNEDDAETVADDAAESEMVTDGPNVASVISFETFPAVTYATSTLIRATSNEPNKQYRVDFNANGGTLFGGSLYNLMSGDVRTITAYATRTGYEFQGWSLTAGGSVAYRQNGTLTMNSVLANNATDGVVTLYAVWKALSYGITFYFDPAYGGSAPQGFSVTLDSPYGNIGGETPTCDLYTFKGWAYTMNATEADWQPHMTFSLTESIIQNYVSGPGVVLYPVWVSQKVTLKFDFNGGKVEGDYLQPMQMELDDVYKFLPHQIPIRYGYDFTSFGFAKGRADYYPNNPLGDAFVLTQEIYDRYADGDTNTIWLYANWKAQGTEYTISLNNSGGSGATSISVVQGYPVTKVDVPKPPAGYWRFAGYGITAPSLMDGKNPELFIDAQGNGTSLGETRLPRVLYAYWIKDVRLIENGGNVGSVVFVKALWGAPLGISMVGGSGDELAKQFPASNVPSYSGNGSWAPTLVHHTFKGYYSEPSGGSRYINELGTHTSAPFTLESTVVYAQWDAIPTYVVSLDPNGGTQSGSTQFVTDAGDACYFYHYAANGSYGMTAIPTRPHYTFDGYYLERGGEEPILYAKAEPNGHGYLVPVIENWTSTSADINLRAHWTENASYMITLDPNGGTQTGATQFKCYVGEVCDFKNGANQVAIPTREGYVFDGYWFTYRTETLLYAKQDSSGYGYLVPVSENWRLEWANDVTLSAHWTKVATSQTYQLSLDTVVPNAQHVGELPTQYTAGVELTLPRLYADGWAFAGWYTNEQYSGMPWTSVPASSTGDKQFYAKWTRDITLHHLNGTADSTIQATYGKDFPSSPLSSSVPSTPAGSWQFLGYCDVDPADNPSDVAMLINSKGQSSWPRFTGDTPYVKGLTDLYAYWMMNVTLNPNGGTANTFKSLNALRGASLGVCMGTSGDTSIYPNFPYKNVPYRNPGEWKPTRPGYTFTGYYSADNVKLIDEEGYPVTSTKYASEDSEVYAHWQADGTATCTVTLNVVNPKATYNGQAAPAQIELTHRPGTATTLPTASSLTCEGWTFDAWYIGENYASSTMTTIPADRTEDIELWARWTRTMNVHNIGLRDDATITATYGNPLRVSVPSDTAGWRFLGYYDVDPARNPQDATCVIASTGSALVSSFTGTTATGGELFDLYAYWMKPIALNPGTGGTAGGLYQINALKGASLGISFTGTGTTPAHDVFPPSNTPANNGSDWKPTRAEYVFAGYYSEATSGVCYINADGYPVASQKYDVTGSSSSTDYVYAHWEQAGSRTVQWVDGNGKVLKTEQVAVGVTPVYSGADPTKAATDQYTYTWNGAWTAAPGEGYYDVIYTATFDRTPRTYQVTLNTNGGTIAAGKNVTSYTFSETASVALPGVADITKAGHAFAGWFEDASFSGAAISSIPVRATGDKVYYAKWEAGSASYSTEHYQQNLEGSGYTLVETVPATGTVGQSVSATPCTYTGFHENTSASDRVASGTIPASGTLTLKLFYDRNLHTVSFASGTTTQVESQKVRYGAKASKPTDPERTGYTFAGWRTGSATGAAYDFSTAVTQDMTLYAGWDAVVYTITWNANKGSFAGGATAQQTRVAHGSPTSADEVPAPSRAGYGFAGWAASADSNTQASLPQSTTRAATYYAIWAANAVAYTVRYVDTEGDQIRTAKTGSGSVDARITETAPAVTGYTLQGAQSQTIILASDASRNTITFTYQANTTTVTFAGEGQGGMMGKTLTYTYGKPLPALTTTVVPARSGYEFAGWKSVEGTMHYDRSGNVALAGAWSGTQATLTLTSAWDANTYHLRYEAGLGSGTAYSKTIRYAQGATFDTLATSGFTAPENCVFSGWKIGNTIYQAGSRADTLTTTANASLTATAQWTRNAYRISWDAAGGSFGTDAQGNPISTIVGNHAKFDKITHPEAPTREGYVFDGWARAGVKVDPDDVATRDQAYTALWTQPLFTLTFKGGTEGAAYMGTYQGSLPNHADAAAAEAAAGANAAGYTFYSTSTHAVQMLVRYGHTGQMLPRVTALYALDGASAASAWVLEGTAVSGATWQGGSEITGDAVFQALYAQGAGRTFVAVFTPRMAADVPAAVSMDVEVEGGNVAVSATQSHFASASAGVIEVRGMIERYTADATREGMVENARQVFGDAAAESVALTMSSSPLTTGRAYRLNLVDRSAQAPASLIAIPAGTGRVEVYYGLQGVSVAALTRDLSDLKIANLAYTIALKG